MRNVDNLQMEKVAKEFTELYMAAHCFKVALICPRGFKTLWELKKLSGLLIVFLLIYK